MPIYDPKAPRIRPGKYGEFGAQDEKTVKCELCFHRRMLHNVAYIDLTTEWSEYHEGYYVCKYCIAKMQALFTK